MATQCFSHYRSLNCLTVSHVCLGARVILACRDMTRARIAADDIRQQSGNGNVVVKKLDLSSLQSVRDLAKDVQENEERLDILINNAGILQRFSLTQPAAVNITNIIIISETH